MKKIVYEDLVQDGEVKFELEDFCKALAYIVGMPEDLLTANKGLHKKKIKRIRKKASKQERYIILYTYRRLARVFSDLSHKKRKFILVYLLVYLLRCTSCKAIKQVYSRKGRAIRLPKEIMEVIDLALVRLKSLSQSKVLQDICPDYFKFEREQVLSFLGRI